MSNKLNIYYKESHVGVLQLYSDSLEFDFIYARKWRESGFEISPHIPFDSAANSGTIKKFLDNLLPEGKALDVFNLFFQISKNNTLALISEIGNETSGALTFFARDRKPTQTSTRPIKYEELTTRVKAQDPVGLIIWDGKPRLSVAGVQDKLPVIYHKGDYSFGEGKLASTHILKFETDRQRHLVINEFICMRLAKEVGLEVAEVEIQHFDTKPALLVKRFDRKRLSEEEIERLHIIDGCQALDLPPTHKYERNMGSGEWVRHIREGVSFEKLFAFATRCKNPVKTKLQILQWAFYNLLIANSDAHGKNISFFIDREGYWLTPFYDMMSIGMYPEFEQELSMGYGESFGTDIKKEDIEAMCRLCDIPSRLAKQELKRVAKKLLKVLEKNDFGTFASNEKERLFVEEMVALLKNRAERYLLVAETL